MWPVITDHLHIVMIACYFCSLVLDCSGWFCTSCYGSKSKWYCYGCFSFYKLKKLSEVVWRVLLWLEWLCVCVKRVVWERIGTAGRWVQGYKNCFPCEKKEHEWWKVKEVFLSGRERRRAVRGQRYTEKREISRSTCDQCRVTNLRSFKALQTGQTLTSPSPDGNALYLPFTPSRHTPPSSSSLQLFWTLESLFPSFYFP